MRSLYRYRLNENSQIKERIVSNFKLTKNWVSVYSKQDALQPFIRTKENPTGIVDYEQLDMDCNNRVVESSKIDFDTPVSLYTRDQLGLMTRDELVQVARTYSFNCFGLNAIFIAKKILQLQSDYMKLQEEKDEQARIEKLSEQLSPKQQDLEFIP